MGIEIFRYSMKYRNRAGGVEGVLLRKDGGYAGLQTWPQFGQPSIEHELKRLRSGQAVANDGTPIGQSLDCLEWDARFRRQQKSAFTEMRLPESHRLLLDESELSNIGSQTGILKCKFLPNRQAVIENTFRWRIDLNGQGHFDELREWWYSLGDHQCKVDFFEDPLPFNREKYIELAKELPVAVDWFFDQWKELPFLVSVLVVKPASLNPLCFLRGGQFYQLRSFFENMVVTSSMDHPFSVNYATFLASLVIQREPDLLRICGLNSHSVFEKIEGWSGNVGKSQPYLDVSDLGFGMTQWLESCEWQEL